MEPKLTHADVARTFDERSDPRAMLAFIRLIGPWLEASAPPPPDEPPSSRIEELEAQLATLTKDNQRLEKVIARLAERAAISKETPRGLPQSNYARRLLIEAAPPDEPEAHPREDDGRVFCEWSLDDVGGDSVWETTCGHAFQFNDGGPAENHMAFCGYCGKPLVETLTSEDVHPSDVHAAENKPNH
jgi:hypothetical protein